MTRRHRWAVGVSMAAVALCLAVLEWIASAAVPSATPASVRHSVPWVERIDAVDAALARRDVGAAERAWSDAHAVAARSGGWAPMVHLGDAALRIGAVDGVRAPYVVRARRLYMDALVRARASRSIEGVVRVAEAFEKLGDRAVVEQCLIIAEQLGATTNTDAMSQLRALVERVPDARATPHPVP